MQQVAVLHYDYDLCSITDRHLGDEHTTWLAATGTERNPSLKNYGSGFCSCCA